MSRIIKILFPVIFLWLWTILTAQPPTNSKFERISIEQGLPGRYVYSIIQDRKGFIWIGSSYGLSRYDGYTLKNYLYDPVDSSRITSIWSLLEDHKGRIWLGTENGVKYFNPKTGRFTHFNSNTKNSNSFNEGWITYIHEDKENQIWIVNHSDGLYQYSENNHQFLHYPINIRDTTYEGGFLTLSEDTLGRFWLGTLTNKLYIFDKKQKKFKIIQNPEVKDEQYYFPENDKDGYIWILTSKSLIQFKDEHTILSRYILPEYFLGAAQRLIQDPNADFWIGSLGGGLGFLNVAKRKFLFYRNDPLNPFSLSNNDIGSILIDIEGNLWVGTYFGFHRLMKSYQQFSAYTHNPKEKNSLSTNLVTAVYEDRDSGLWIGTIGGLNYLNLKTNQFEVHYLSNNQGYKSNIIKGIKKDTNNNLWIGCTDGLYRVNEKGKALDQNHKGLLPKLFKDNLNFVIANILIDKKGRLWLGTSFGIFLYNSDNNDFIYYPYTTTEMDVKNDYEIYRENEIQDAFTEDRFGNLWIPYRSKGITQFNPETGSFKRYLFEANNPLSPSSNHVNQLLTDKDGNILICTAAGLDKLIFTGKKSDEFIIERQLVVGAVNAVLEDDNGILWLGTLQGLIRYNPKTKKTRKYDASDGLMSTGFNGIPYKSPYSGKLYFPTEWGLIHFHPDSLRDNPFVPPIEITALFYYDRKDKSGLPIEVENITYQDVVNFPYYQNNLVIEFAALSYNKSSKNQYAYQLSSSSTLDSEDWIQLGTESRLNLTNLNPGTYYFRVKGSNGDGIWNEEGRSLKIIIRPPWYWSPITKGLYALLLLGAIYYFYRFQLNRRLAHAEAKRLRELDQVKTSLYTNITHEFRTPLTIILGMADKVEQAPRQWLQEGIQMIKRNGQSLLRLVNQMLDLSKLEAGSLPVNMVQGDIITYLHRLLELFRSYADSKNIQLEFASEYEQFVMDYDADKLKDIISNLLSNALKFTPEEGVIQLAVGSEQFTVGSESHLRQAYGDRRKLEGTEYIYIIVRDTGVGISQEKLPHVFDRFYQADDSATRRGEGTGIGLALTKELVRLLGGTIEVESKLGKGSVFQVRLPVRNTAPLLEATPEVEPAMTAFATTETATAKKGMASLPQMLIVEDNADVISYLRSCLQDQYRIEVAYNGQEGIDKAIEIVPDVIISDVMMPEKDGFELCRTLKDDMRTSHIPIVLLTARADMDSRLEGLEGGADAYLTKPFNEQELEVSLRKSLELRQRLRERYTRDIPISPDDSFSRDDAFITKLHQVLEAHYSDEDFNIPALAAAMELSHAQLGRKLHALLDTTPQLYLRHYRLQKAYHLLKHSDLSVKEVAFATGFSDPAYFSNAFLEEFQQRPSDFRE